MIGSVSPVFHSHPPSPAWQQCSPWCRGRLVSDPPQSGCGWRCPPGWPWRGWWCWRWQSATAPPGAAQSREPQHWWWCDHRRGGDHRWQQPRSWNYFSLGLSESGWQAVFNPSFREIFSAENCFAIKFASNNSLRQFAQLKDIGLPQRKHWVD